MTAFYQELQKYVDKIQSTPHSQEERICSAERYRRIGFFIKRFSFFIKTLSSSILILFLVSIVLIFMFPDLFLKYPSVLKSFIIILLTGTLMKIFGVLVDLELPRIQVPTMVVFTGYFSWVAADPVISGCTALAGIALLALVLFTNHVKHQIKIRSLAWLLQFPEETPRLIAQRHNAIQERLHGLGIGDFDSPAYLRVWQLTGSSKQRQANPCSPKDINDDLPGNGFISVRIWQRDPRRDLSALREFFVCCFLGGSQDASAFDFLLNKSISFLDMATQQGRIIRVLLMACLMGEGEKQEPVLVVNAVFGRESGLIGGYREDNRFIRRQIEAYARFSGFRHVLYALSPTNKRPRLFVDDLMNSPPTPVVTVFCRLVLEAEPIKLEIFNRSRPGRNVYALLFLEMFNFTDNYATHGHISGFLITLDNHFFDHSGSGMIPEGDASLPVEVDCGNIHLSLDSRLASNSIQKSLASGLGDLGDFIPKDREYRVNVVCSPAPPSPLVAGLPTGGTLLVSTAIFQVKDDFWRERLVVQGILQAFWWQWHPLGEEKIPQLGQDVTLERVLDSVTYLAKLGKTLELTGKGHYLDKIIHDAVRSRYRVHEIFKAKKIFLAAQEAMERNDVVDTTDLAKSLLSGFRGDSPVFWEKYCAGLDDLQRGLVEQVLAQDLADALDAVITDYHVREDFPYRDHESVGNAILQAEKSASKVGCVLSPKRLEKIAWIKEKKILCARLVQVEVLIEKGKEGEARTMLKEIRVGKKQELVKFGLMGVVSTFWWRARLNPLDRLEERLNLGNYW